MHTRTYYISSLHDTKKKSTITRDNEREKSLCVSRVHRNCAKQFFLHSMNGWVQKKHINIKLQNCNTYKQIREEEEKNGSTFRHTEFICFVASYGYGRQGATIHIS